MKLIAVIVFVLAQTSPYASSKDRAIKALSDDDIRDLRQGKGTGLALAAELNSYPGPKHVLELTDRLKLTTEQVAQVRAVHDRMQKAAAGLGSEIIDLEQRLDRAFASRSIDSDLLEELTSAIALRHGKLRFVHLDAHIATRSAMTPQQINAYEEARGYGGHAHAHH